MKQLLVLSGKGGTGKTTVASALIELSNAKTFADCDVDAPNLHLVSNFKTEAKETDYYGMPKAIINTDICIKCGKCNTLCRFDAIEKKDGLYKVDPISCEGCGVCEYFCPVNAIEMKKILAGKIKLYKDKLTSFSTAKLKMGNGTSGMLVSEVKSQMKENANEESKLAIIDGSPGIGCPVIASISGVDMVLIVAEPSISGISDMKRIIEISRKFMVDINVCVNKYDTNIKGTLKIKKFCEENNIPFIGKIPYDKTVIESINNGKTIVKSGSPSSKSIEEIYEKILERMF